jgi:indole-3-glycerol phosphate synthase
LTETQADSRRPDILERIVETKHRELEVLHPHRFELRDRARDMEPARDFAGALAALPHVSLIAEIKRRSPGAGEIRPDLDPHQLAEFYAEAGASALSVLTDHDYFGGSLDDLRAARRACPLPALRKDFTLHPTHVFEARAAGADAVLLIVRILEQGLLEDLQGTALELGMAVLVEVHDAAELERAIAANSRIVGINNRDLATFKTDLAVTEALLDQLPSDAITVSESGIRTADDVARLGRAGVDAVLVGESILAHADPAEKVAELARHPVVTRGA